MKLNYPWKPIRKFQEIRFQKYNGIARISTSTSTRPARSREQAVKEYGQAIGELTIANIFPGDMLWKNFGVTRYNRVVFYDYDDIEYMTDIHFRVIPEAPYPEMEMSGEPWYSVGRHDVFPEEFASFLLGSPKARSAFLKYHRALLNVKFWQTAQDNIRAGHVEDFFPYPEELRFCRAFAGS